MANRVPVEEVRQTAQLRPVAAPVGAYVRMPNWAISDSMAQSRFKAATEAFKELTNISTKVLDISDDQYEQEQGIAAFADFQRWKATRDTSKDNAGNPEDVLNNINQQFSEYFGDETRGTRRKVLDRVYQDYASGVVGARTQEAARETMLKGIDDVFVAATPDLEPLSKLGRNIVDPTNPTVIDPNNPAHKQAVDLGQAVFTKLAEKVGAAKANDIISKQAALMAEKKDFSFWPWMVANKRHLTQSNADETRIVMAALTKPTESEQFSELIDIDQKMRSMSPNAFKGYLDTKIQAGVLSGEAASSKFNQRIKMVEAENAKILEKNQISKDAQWLWQGGDIAAISSDLEIGGKRLTANERKGGAVSFIKQNVARAMGLPTDNPTNFVTPVKGADGKITYKVNEQTTAFWASVNDGALARTGIDDPALKSILVSAASAVQNVNDPNREYVVQNAAAAYDTISVNNPAFIRHLPEEVQKIWGRYDAYRRAGVDRTVAMHSLSQPETELPPNVKKKLTDKTDSLTNDRLGLLDRLNPFSSWGPVANKGQMQKRVEVTANALAAGSQNLSASAVVESAINHVQANSVYIGGKPRVATTAALYDTRMDAIGGQLGRPYQEVLSDYASAWMTHNGDSPFAKAKGIEKVMLIQDERDPMVFYMANDQGFRFGQVTPRDVIKWDEDNKALKNKNAAAEANANLTEQRQSKPQENQQPVAKQPSKQPSKKLEGSNENTALNGVFGSRRTVNSPTRNVNKDGSDTYGDAAVIPKKEAEVSKRTRATDEVRQAKAAKELTAAEAEVAKWESRGGNTPYAREQLKKAQATLESVKARLNQ